MSNTGKKIIASTCSIINVYLILNGVLSFLLSGTVNVSLLEKLKAIVIAIIGVTALVSFIKYLTTKSNLHFWICITPGIALLLFLFFTDVLLN